MKTFIIVSKQPLAIVGLDCYSNKNLAALSAYIWKVYWSTRCRNRFSSKLQIYHKDSSQGHEVGPRGAEKTTSS